jgi:hypothetical protein
MKNTIPILISILLISGIKETLAQVPNYVPTSGLQAWYPFNGNANDESGNGHNGTVNGPTLSIDRFGSINSAYQFNSTNMITTTCPGVTGTGDRTICFWIKPDGLNQTSDTWVIAGYGCGSGSFAGCSWGTCYFQNNIGIDINSSYAYYNSPLSTSNWTFICAVYSPVYGTNNISTKFYVNGVLLTTTSQTGGSGVSMNTGAGNWFFGKNLAAQSYLGKLDDIGIWNRVLNQSEINQLYTGGPCVNYQTITVTDTLIINANLTGLNPVTFQNSIKVYPNPTSNVLNVDFGSNFSSLAGYSMRIDNAAGQTVFITPVIQQLYTSNLNGWTGNGLYLVYLINPQGSVVDVRKIIIQ